MEQNTRQFDILEEFVGIRLDKFLSLQFPQKSRTNLQNLIEQQHILVNGQTISKNYKLRLHDVVKITIPPPSEYQIVAQNIPLDIRYEDDDLLIVNKPKGMVVHPAPGNYENTLVNALMYHCGHSLSGINGVIRPGIVHRIDKNTSGLLMVAKNDISHQCLAQQIKQHTLLREYQAIVYGNVKQDSGMINAPIGRNQLDRKKMCVTSHHAKEAITHYQVLQRYGEFTHVKFRLETGRTHQIRVHMAYIGHPVAGDDVYGPKKVISKLQGQCLHAKTIGFIHPNTKQQMIFDSELPTYFTAFLNSIATE